jgi:hypothetical protein
VTYYNLYSIVLYRYPKHLLQTAATMEQWADSKKEFYESSTYQLWIQSSIGSSNLKISPHTFLLWAARNLTTNQLTCTCIWHYGHGLSLAFNITDRLWNMTTHLHMTLWPWPFFLKSLTFNVTDRLWNRTLPSTSTPTRKRENKSQPLLILEIHSETII